MKGMTSLTIAAAMLAACSGKPASNAAATTAPHSPPPSSASVNGRDIFQTGRDIDGHPIIAANPPLRNSCAACHGAKGAGGLHIADHAVSADLRHNALVTTQKPPYNLKLLERAISTGTDNTGEPLNRVMPRWKMSSRDLHDVAAYVLTLK